MKTEVTYSMMRLDAQSKFFFQSNIWTKNEAKLPKMVSFISECVRSHSTATCNVHDTLL